MPRRHLLAFVPLVLLLSACPQPEIDEPLFEDEALIGCVQQHLGVSGELEESDVDGLEHLDCTAMSIVDISGLEAFTGLQSLSLFENDVWDLRPLEGLTQLEELQLGSNNIGEVAPLAGLTNLERLGLGSNKIEDLSPLGGLTELRWLNLDDNRIEQNTVAALCGLDELIWLTIDHNGLDDVDDELDCLDDLDELYWGFQGDGGERSDDFGATPEELLVRGELGLELGEDGKLSFHYDLGETRHPVLKEHIGTLGAQGERLVLVRGGREIEVGRIRGDDWELCTGDFATVCTLSVGRKHDSGTNRAPDTATRAPAISLMLTLVGSGYNLPGIEIEADQDYAYGEFYGDLERYILPSPNQFDAGTCLFMSNTGAMEILLNQQLDNDEAELDGDTDLSERFLMNGSGFVPDSAMEYVMTDLTYAYEYNGGAVLNRDYPWECTNSSCSMNWDNDLPGDWEDILVETPETERTVMFLDPDLDEYSIWKTGLVGLDVVERIKYELRTKNAPVVLLYNHYLYWHSVVIVGYDDTEETDGCPMVMSSINYFEEEGANSYVNAIEDHMDDLGGCVDKGVFYVRDSIYEGDEMYDYGPWSDYYAARIVEHSYNWALFLGNHAFTVQRR